MLDLPEPDILYAALIRRDPAYEGRAIVGVKTTGIYCRLTCPSRKPRPENCLWFADPASARAAGFRACRRCHPDGSHAEGFVKLLVRTLQDEPARRWREADLVEMGLDPSTVRRAFQRHYGQSFLQMARAARVKGAMDSLMKGERMIEAQLEAGFESASGFRAAFSRLFGHAPHELRGQGGLRADWIETPLGGMIAITDDQALHLLEFTDRKALPDGLRKLSSMVGGRIGLGRNGVTDQVERELAAYFKGNGPTFSVPVALHGTAFQRQVWQELQRIPAGTTLSYGDLARKIGNPNAVRAVARTNATNRVALVVPCHRVIGADGSMTGYAGGLWRKRRLIEAERAYADGT
ncbi:trifunctional transcriptional activator/DNA repair protein Ada/methylated-DNA--[protein]-cysteine S-methyltransferase [Paracoccus sp. Z330]|uniref:Trifunctional transcriptional activator/DNA repair protein Ada/methylated-DNA--[protein]-cysteine S-methyltransferase n=1 Tax=Paracoccus onchidii TaxID=3017813 RepID=A0ABT4ZBV3_9RHOB|nr:trifunctional transcriptional activator/DNA repair protein Ada/methylated-DNA--[protein]-cysteine S-methyltransferase [Paracoccus onchidii]MDB6176842.1 trifunctional transcriptional activator/DNA repair protein Ada/methylated-DNA--[protein]-cysteine S-methyltransferase [Paracoccus onchidii]